MKTHQASPKFCNCAIRSQPCSVFKNLIQLINFWVTWWLCVLNKRECFSGNLCSFLFFCFFKHFSDLVIACTFPLMERLVQYLDITYGCLSFSLEAVFPSSCTLSAQWQEWPSVCLWDSKATCTERNLYKCYMSVQFTVKIRFWEELNIYVNMEADLWVFGMESSVLEEIKLSKYNDPNITQELIEVF